MSILCFHHAQFQRRYTPEEMAGFETIKAQGNDYFRDGDNAKAKACYTTIIDSLCARFALHGVEERDLKVHKMFAASLANRAACDIKLENYTAGGAASTFTYRARRTVSCLSRTGAAPVTPPP